LVSSGWIKLYRQIQDSWLWEEIPFSKGQAWIDLVLLANHQDKKVMWEGNLTIIKRGQFVTSIRKLSERWGWNKDKTLNFLRSLEADTMIDRDSDSKRTLITIAKYRDFQDSLECNSDSKSDTNTDTNQTPTRPRADTTPPQTIKKEYKEIKEDYIISSNKCPVSRSDINIVLAAWNDLDKYGIKPVLKLTASSKRYSFLIARIKEYSVQDVLSAIEKIKNSDFLKGWPIKFDWFVRPNNFCKVLEGNYDNRAAGETGNGNSYRTTRTYDDRITGQGPYKEHPIEDEYLFRE